MSLNFYAYEDQFERKQVEYHQGENIRQVFQRLIETEQIQDEVGFQITLNNIIIVLKRDHSRLVNLDQLVQDIARQTNEDPLELMLINPTEEGGVLIEYIVNKKYCYFENYVNKNDQLQTFINALCKRINFEQKFEIKVNGKKNNSKAPFEKKTIKQLIGSSNSQKIKVQINQQEKEQSEPKEKEKKSEPQKEKSEPSKERKKVEMKSKNQLSQQNSKKQQIKQIEKVQKKLSVQSLSEKFQQKPKPQASQKEIKVEQSELSGNQNQSSFVNKKQPLINKGSLNQVKYDFPEVNSRLPPNIKEQKKEEKVEPKRIEKYVFSIKFETNSGNRSQAYQVQKTKTMEEILPEVLRILAEAGFDWDTNWNDPNDYHDKLAIFCGNQQYKKYQAKFMSVLAKNTTHDFVFQRVFQGG